MMRMMETYIARLNIERFQSLLSQSLDQVQRRTVEALLAVEQERLWQIDLTEERTHTADVQPKAPIETPLKGVS